MEDPALASRLCNKEEFCLGCLKKEKNFKYQKIGNYDVLTELSVKDIQKDHRTDISFKQISVDIDMDEKIFQEKSLKRLPVH